MNEELKIFISAEIAGLKKELQNAQKEVNKTAKDGESGFKKFGEAAKKAGKVVADGLKVASAAIIAAGAALVALSESTAEYRVAQAKLTTAFEAAGSSAEQAKATYNDLYRVLGDGDVATEAANHLAKLTTGQAELAEWTNICQGVYATFGDSLPIEGLAEAANETAKTGAVTGSLADALNWAGVSEEEFQAKLDATNSEAEREALIRSTLSGLYTDAAAKYEENAAGLLAANEAQAKMTAGLAALGAAVEPVVTILKSLAGDTLQQLVPHFQTISSGLQDMFNGVEGGEDKLAKGIGGAIDKIAKTITKLIPKLIPVAVNIINALIKGITSALPALIQSVVDAIPLIIEGIVSALPAIIDGIALLIEEIAAALPEVIGVLVEALPSIITTLMENLITVIPLVIDGVVNAVLVLLESLPTILQPIIENIPTIITSIVEGLLGNLPLLVAGLIDLILAIVEMLPTIFESLVSSIPFIYGAIIEALLSSLPELLAGLVLLIAKIVAALPQMLATFVETWINIFVEAWEGIKKAFSNIVEWFGDNWKAVVDEIKRVFGVLGDWFAGIWDDIKGVFKPVATWFKDTFKSAVDGIKSVFSTIGTFFTGVWDNIKSIFSKVGKTIGDAVSGAFKTAINWVLEKAIGIINGFIGAINTAISVLNAIPGVSIKKISKLDVPELAKGGVVDSATLAMIGEQGKEAIVPLENNTEWIEKIAERLSNALNSGNTPIVMEVDGKTFAQVSFSTMNEYARQTGKMPLKVFL